MKESLTKFYNELEENKCKVKHIFKTLLCLKYVYFTSKIESQCIKCMTWVVLPQKTHQASKYSGICEYYFIWRKGVFVDVIKFRILKLDHPELSRWSLYLMTSVFIRRREDKDTDKKVMWRWGWRLHTSQKMPRATGRWKRTGQILPQGFWREYGLANTSILDFWPSEV